MKKHFHTTRQVVTTVKDAISPKELDELLTSNKPTEIWHNQWSSKIPHLIITEYNDKGFMMFCNAWADKTPQQYNAIQLHNYLRCQGLEDCYINVKSEAEAWEEFREGAYNNWKERQNRITER